MSEGPPPAVPQGPPADVLQRYQNILHNIRQYENLTRDVVNNELYIAQREGNVEEENMAMRRINQYQRIIRRLEARLHREEDLFGEGEGSRESKG